ncbi:LacI family DNA-binding transcriptional regulator [Amycolatopsis sp. CA-128772]|uniref:LacI family DNA-binding transcriptional regulator n=1 Tax=Amycolatopsis sp. CA-128772 TaxID=2073159 RepID=UPI000CD0BC4C|nr:LacI family DNA-binding transcriptional regulator [Amycolatopsis sp. CA-128772]
MKRPTITDIAREAGVSKGAVSYALNGRPGVSEATRQRITEIARELGWAPSSTARALSGGRAGATGLVLDRSLEAFVPALLDGFEGELLLQVATGRDAALAIHRRWRAERKVDGVLLTEPGCAAELVRIGLPAVVLGGPGGVPGVPSVLVDDVAGALEALEYLAALGHRRVVRIAGAAAFADPEARKRAFTTAATGLPYPGTVHPEPSADAIRRVLAARPRPTALLCDTDDLALAALAAARELGLAVPRDLSVVSWDDTPLCRLVRPALTAIRRPLAELGALAAAVLHDVLAGERAGDVCASRPRLITRGSTGPANP